MKNLSRKEVIAKFNEIVEKFGRPKNGKIFYENQLISKIVNELSMFSKVHIKYENGAFDVSSSLTIKNKYADDYEFIGTVNAEEWFTKEQLKALYELAFGYQF